MRPHIRDVGLLRERANLSQISLATDNVFSDGASLELATVTGDVTSGMTATITVAVRTPNDSHLADAGRPATGTLL